MATKAKAAPKMKRSRTDYTVCVCADDQHAVVHHRTPARPVKPTAAVVERYFGHVIEHTIAWTPWKASS
jgi:hypothetical protein